MQIEILNNVEARNNQQPTSNNGATSTRLTSSRRFDTKTIFVCYLLIFSPDEPQVRKLASYPKYRDDRNNLGAFIIDYL